MKNMLIVAGLMLLSSACVQAAPEKDAAKLCKLGQLVQKPEAQAVTLGAVAGVTAAKKFSKNPKEAAVIGLGVATVYYSGYKVCGWAKSNWNSRKVVAPVVPAQSVPAEKKAE